MNEVKKMSYKKNIINYIIPYVGMFVCTWLIYYFVFSFDKWNINVPINFSGDTITDGGTLTLAAKAIEGEGILSTKCFWTIDNQRITWDIMDGGVHYLLMRLLAVFIHSAGKLTNIYFILTYGLCGCFMYYALSSLEINKAVAFSVAIAYAFVPGHTMRGVGHMGVGSCFALPLIILVCYNIISWKFESTDKQMNRKMIIEGIVGAILVGFTSIYFCFFSMILHGCCLIISAVNKKKNGTKISCVCLGTDVVCALFTVVIPNLLSRGNAILQIERTREISQIREYGLNIAQLLLPVRGHRITLFAKIRDYYATFFGENENAMSSLGIVFSLMLIVSIISIFIDRQGALLEKIRRIGKWILLILLISVTGGGAELIGLFVSSIRCYNRMSFIIAGFSAVGLAFVLDYILKVKKKRTCIVVCMVLVAISVFDQTTSKMKITDASAAIYENMWNSEQNFFDLVANTDAKQVLIYPSKYSDLYSENESIKYDIMKPYIHAKGICFSTGYKEGSKTDLWIQELEQYSAEEKLKLCATQNIDGILLYKAGFRDENVFNETYVDLLQCVGEENVSISEDGQWVYVRNDKYISELKAWNQEKLDKAAKRIISNEMDVGTMYEIGSSRFSKYIKGGFSRAEGVYRWSQGNESEMQFRVNEESYGNLRVELGYSYLFLPQSIKIYANDSFICEEKITSPNSYIEIPINKEIIQDGQVLLKIVYSSAKSPASLSEGNTDTRELAIAWTTMRVIDVGVSKIDNINYYDYSYLEKYLGR